MQESLPYQKWNYNLSMKSCRFVTHEVMMFNHLVRGLEITCENGFVETIYVTKEPAFARLEFHSWHYELSPDGKFISLTGIINNSVNFGDQICHVTITNWPLLEDDISNDEPC